MMKRTFILLAISFAFCYAAVSCSSYGQEIKQYIKAARNGDAQAQYSLGMCYYNGDGVPQDYERAVKWYMLAAEQGNMNAQAKLACCYCYGEGVDMDYEEAVKWCRLAAEQGDADSQFNIGISYKFGVGGYDQDNSEAIKWTRLAAEQGHSGAQNNLGTYYYDGDGVPQDYNEAVKWFRLAAEQGNAQAQNNMGVCYLYGISVAQDFDEGMNWIRLAAENGSEIARKRILEMEDENSSCKKSLQEIRLAGWSEKDWYDNDYIREIRKYIDGYNEGKIEDTDLDAYKDIIKGNFIVLDIDTFPFGGLFVDIIFIDHPETVFSTWVYSFVDEETESVTGYEVRGGLNGDYRSRIDFTKEGALSFMKDMELIAW